MMFFFIIFIKLDMIFNKTNFLLIFFNKYQFYYK